MFTAGNLRVYNNEYIIIRCNNLPRNNTHLFPKEKFSSIPLAAARGSPPVGGLSSASKACTAARCRLTNFFESGVLWNPLRAKSNSSQHYILGENWGKLGKETSVARIRSVDSSRPNTDLRRHLRSSRPWRASVLRGNH